VKKHTEYKSQTTLVNASTLNDNFLDQICQKSSSVLNEMASVGLIGVFPRHPLLTSALIGRSSEEHGIRADASNM
jgi:hypothetical protein